LDVNAEDRLYGLLGDKLLGLRAEIYARKPTDAEEGPKSQSDMGEAPSLDDVQIFTLSWYHIY
jgi:hypothetical protein